MSEVIPALLTLIMLVLLQAVLGFDNLLYISLESKRAPVSEQKRVRTLGIAIAVALRIVLLFALVKVMALFEEPFAHWHWQGVVDGHFSGHAVIVLLGGAFILYTATKEIFHMTHLEEAEHEKKETAAAAKVIALIVLMNLVFSFDSILSAMALTDNFWIMSTAIVIGGILMIVLADRVSSFLQRNRMYEVLGLFVLFLVGVMLLSEGAHHAHLKLFGYEITAMSKATFYFVITILVLIDIVQSRYQKKLLLQKERMQKPVGVGDV